MFISGLPEAVPSAGFKAALKAKGESLPKSRIREMHANFGLVGVGLSLGVLGVVMSLKSAAGGH